MQLRNMCNWSSKKMFYQSQVFKQNITRQKCFHSKPHTTHQFEKKKKWEGKHYLTGTGNLWFLVSACKYSDSLVFLHCCTTGKPVIKSTMAQIQNIYSETCKLDVF